MNIRQLFQRALRHVLVLGALAFIGVVAVVPWSLPGTFLQNQLARQVANWGGFTLTSHGRVTIAVLPRPRLKLENVELQSPALGIGITASSIRADINLESLLTGHVALGDFDLRQPIIRVDGARLAAFVADAQQSDGLSQRLTPLLHLGVLTCKSGTLLWTSGTPAPPVTLEGLTFRLDWRAPNRPASLRASAQVQGARQDLTAFIENPASLLANLASVVRLKLDSDILTLEASGTANRAGTLMFEGKVTASTPDLAALARQFKIQVPVPPAFTASKLDAKALVNGQSLELADLDLAMGGSHFEGSMAVHAGTRRPLVSATLATDSLDLQPYVQGLSSIWDDAGQLSTQPLPIHPAPADLDVRVSASRVSAGPLSLNDAALGVILNGERAEASIADARMGEGSFKARVTLTTGGDGTPQLHAAGAAIHLALKPLLSQVAGTAPETQSLTGTVSGPFVLDACGPTPAALLQSLSGQVSLHFSDGEIMGPDIEQALRRIDKRSPQVEGESRLARTAYTDADALVLLDNGIATVSDTHVHGPGANLTVNGRVDLLARTLDLSAEARQAGDAEGTGPRVRVSAKGGLGEARLTLDRPTTDPAPPKSDE